MRAKASVYQVSDIDKRVVELQSQIDRLSTSLLAWTEKQDLAPIERRLSELTQRCAAIIDSWADRDERVQQDSSARLHDLQRTLEHQLNALRAAQEAPVKQLREHTATLTEVCVATATSALTSVDRAEARIAGLESSLHQRLTELSEQIQTALNEVRSLTGPQPQALTRQTPAWPLEGVLRLHNQLRDPGTPVPEPQSGGEPARPVLPESTSVLSDRVETLEKAVTDGQSDVRDAVERTGRARRLSWAAVALFAIGFVVAAVLAVRLQRQIAAASTRVADAERQVHAANDNANQRIAAARQEAAHEINDARLAALKAQTIGDVLAAPDLVRYNLVGGDETTRFTAQLLWSRSRGLVFSGSRLPSPPPDSIYQIWLLTSAAPVSAGVFVPDTAGRITLAIDTPPRVPRPVAGVAVTIEPTGGAVSPKGATLLTRGS